MSANKPLHIGEGLIVLPNGLVGPPQIVVDHLHAGYSVIPTTGKKTPLIKEWNPYKERQPTAEEVREWITTFGSDIDGWARITGPQAGVFVADFDGAAVELLRDWNLSPHVMSPSGGYHLILRHPGWYVTTCNSKTSKSHWEHYPNVDIRGDGAYSLIAGLKNRGGYTWLRDFTDIDELDVLPIEFRAFFGLLEPSSESETKVIPKTTTIRILSSGEGPTPDHLIERALYEASLSGRNNGGHWLVQQLWDHGYERQEILEIGERYVLACPETNMKGELEAYTMDDFQRTVNQVLARPRRDKWGEGEISTMADFGDVKWEPEEEKNETENDSSEEKEQQNRVDLILVPTEMGAEQEYAPWAIQDFVRLGSRAILYGQSGAAKSYAAVDLARAAATGTMWLGKAVIPGSVIYIAAEDYLGIHHRVETAIRHAGISRKHQVRVLERSLPLTNHADVSILQQIMDCLPEKPRYVIIDNLSLCMGDGDPNEGTAAKAFVDGCQLLQDYHWRATSADKETRGTDLFPITVIVVHHTNKAANFNGSQYFKNFVDAMSELVWDEKSISRTIYCRKQRHGEYHRPLPFDLVEVDAERHLCVIHSTALPPPATDTEDAWRNLLPQEERVLTSLREAELERFFALSETETELPRGLTRADITVRSRVHTRSVRRFVNALVGAGFVEAVTEEVEDSKGRPKLRKVVPERLQLTDGGRQVVDKGFEDVRIQGRETYRTRKMRKDDRAEMESALGDDDSDGVGNEN